MTSEIEIGYVAGIIDGEAYIGIKKSSPTRDRITPAYHARIQIRMVDEGAIRFIAERLGGNYYRETAHSAQGRPLYCFAASNKKAETILRVVTPHLIVKRSSAEIVLHLRTLQAERMKHKTKITGYRNWPNYYGTPRQVAVCCLSDDYVARCEALYQACKSGNHGE